jgi:hypothetical protein
LDALLAPLAGDPPASPDTAVLPDDHPLAYAWYGGRGRMGNAAGDSLLALVAAWFRDAGLEPVPAFPLPDSEPFRFLSFRADSSGMRYTGDTLVLERDPAVPGRYRESLTAGSPGRASDSTVWLYSLRIEGDSLVAGAEAAFASRLFGKLGKRTPLLALTGLRPLVLGGRFGLPAATGGAPEPSGIWPGDHAFPNRTLSSPAVKLTARDPKTGSRAGGCLYTAAGGPELRWSVAPDQSFAEGWDRL